MFGRAKMSRLYRRIGSLDVSGSNRYQRTMDWRDNSSLLVEQNGNTTGTQHDSKCRAAWHEKARTEQTMFNPGKEVIMSRRRGISLAAIVIGIACLVTVSSDAFARPGRGGGGFGGPGVGAGGAGRPGIGVGGAGRHVHHHHVYRHPVARGAAVVGVGAAAAGAYYARPQCGYYPYPPCY